MMHGLVKGPNLSSESDRIPGNILGNSCHVSQISTVMSHCPLVQSIFPLLYTGILAGALMQVVV